MGIGPVPALKAALSKADKSLQHMELIEVLLLRCMVIWNVMFYICHSLTYVTQDLSFKNYVPELLSLNFDVYR